jgi:DNA-binding CsgD family transcriptional regulator
MSNDIIFTSTPNCLKCKGLLMGISDYSSTQSPCYCCELLGKQIIGVTPVKSVESKPVTSNRQSTFRMFEDGKTTAQVKEILSLTTHATSDYRYQYNIRSDAEASHEQSKSQHELAIKLYSEGSSVADVAEKTGFAISTVKNIIGGTTAAKDKKTKRDAEIMRMAEKGISIKDIAKKFNMSVATIKNIQCKKSA